MRNVYELISVDQDVCMHCGACVGTCPRNAMFLHDLTVASNEECNGCGICVKVCPVGAISKNNGGDSR